VSEVVISELLEGTLYSKISLVSQVGTTDIDARPSDAIALALRVGAPIFASETVMEEASVQEVVEHPATPMSAVSSDESSSRSPEDYLKRLHERLDRAVSEENYEEAAEIRDKIKKIQAEASKQ
jgi:bifunctional DNase/RNase